MFHYKYMLSTFTYLEEKKEKKTGQATSNVMQERVYSPSSSQTRPKQNHVSA